MPRVGRRRVARRFAATLSALGSVLAVACGSPDAPPSGSPPLPDSRDGGQGSVTTTPPSAVVPVGPATFRASPVILRAGIYDANETSSCSIGGCVNAFLYFAAAPALKSGRVPETYDGDERYDTTTWASNFQGPNRYPNETERVQWEWSIDNTESAAPRYLGSGECAGVRAQGQVCFEALPNAAACANGCIYYEHSGACQCSGRLHMDNAGAAPAVLTTWGKQKIAQVSARRYPLVHAVETVSAVDQLTKLVVEVREDDEGLGDDYVGSFEVDRRDCKAQVFDAGKTRGWTAPRTYLGDGGARDKDIAFVEYKIWCERL